jgi:class 3 adenylate cyclase
VVAQCLVRRTGAGHRQPGEILASRTMRDLVVGSGQTLGMTTAGLTPLEGVKGTWQLFAVVDY